MYLQAKYKNKVLKKKKIYKYKIYYLTYIFTNGHKYTIVISIKTKLQI